MALNCDNTKKNIGVSNQCDKNVGLIRGAISTPTNYTISATDAASATKWLEGIVSDTATRIYMFPKWAVNLENISSDEIRQDTPLESLKVFPGQHRYALSFAKNFEIHKNIYSHSGSSGRAFMIDHNDVIWGTSDDDGVTLKGFLLSDLNVRKLQVNTGAEKTLTIVEFYMTDNNELDKRGEGVDASAFIGQLEPLTTVNLTQVGTSTASLVTVDVKSGVDGIGVSGFVQADFDLTGIGGTPSGVVENPVGSGTYEISGATFTAGNVDLVTADQLSIIGYESSGPVAITI